MECRNCQSTPLAFPIPGDLRTHVPWEADGAVVCPTCLVVDPLEDPPQEHPDFAAIADAYPADPGAAIPMTLAIGLLTSLALHRPDIEALLDRVERAGADPMLVLDRLAAAGSVDSQVDLPGRKRQLEQLLE